MYKIKKINSNHVVDFAAEELKKYLRMMMPRCGEIEISYDPSAADGFRLGLMTDFSLDTSDAEDIALDDIVYIDCDENGGIIAGSNYRSILLAVYRYLRENGCRWLFPGIDGEYIPIREIKPVRYRKLADNRYRGQCNEGGEFQPNMIEVIDFTPKLGLNVFMMEFDNPKTYYDRYYNHTDNTANREPEPVSAETTLQWKRQCEAEISKRGLEFHDMGHGWTSESFGISSIGGWTRDASNKVPEESREFVAMINGKRELFNDVALNTNFCMSNPRAREKVVDAVIKYAEKSSHVDYLHVWLADWQRNHCECDECRKMIPSDWYVMLLNEIDAALIEKGLDTRIGFCVYSDTTFAPEVEKFNNPARFTFVLGAITRSYRYSVEEHPNVPKTPYIRNVTGRLSTMEEYIVHAREWMERTGCRGAAYEYHFWKHQFYEPGGIGFAKRIYEDVISYKKNGFLGIIEDGSQRSFFPNGFAFYTFAETLFDMSLSFDDILTDYFSHAYGDIWQDVVGYLGKIGDNMRQDYIEVIHSMKIDGSRFYDPEEAVRFRAVKGITEELSDLLEKHKNMPYRAQTVAVRLLMRYSEYCYRLSKALVLKAMGANPEALEEYRRFFDDFGKYEIELERYYDHSLARSSLSGIFHSKIFINQ